MVQPSRSRPGFDVALLGVMLLSTVAGELKLPGLGVGVQNLLLPGCAAGLLWQHRETIPAAARRHARLLGLALGLAAWTGICALASPQPAVALHHFAKALTYLPPFLAFLLLLARPDRQRAAHLALLAFLLFLALGGAAEALYPASAPFRLLRSERSLSILPRIASLQPWPNPFGVAMASGLGLAGALLARGWIGGRWAVAGQALFVVQAAQSGSRNAWGALAVTLASLARGLGWRRVVVPGLVFVAALLVLPVAAWQAGLRDRVPVIEALVPAGARTSPSIADPLQSLSLRSRLWRASAACVAWRPWLGLGPGVFSVHVAPRVVDRPGLNTHCLPLNLLVELGLPGLGLATLGLLTAFRSGRPPAEQVHPAGTALAALLSGQLVDCFLYDPTSVVLLLFLAASLATPPAD